MLVDVNQKVNSTTLHTASLAHARTRPIFSRLSNVLKRFTNTILNFHFAHCISVVKIGATILGFTPSYKSSFQLTFFLAFVILASRLSL